MVSNHITCGCIRCTIAAYANESAERRLEEAINKTNNQFNDDSKIKYREFIRTR